MGRDARGALRRWADALGLPPAARDRMCAAWRAKRYRRGEVLFYEGDTPADVYFLCRWLVKLVRRALGERQHILLVVSGPDMLGERAVIAGTPYAAAAQMMEDSLGILKRSASSIMARRAGVLSNVRHLARKLARADDAAFDLARGRFASCWPVSSRVRSIRRRRYAVRLSSRGRS